jgi:hypothetical protein
LLKAHKATGCGIQSYFTCWREASARSTGEIAKLKAILRKFIFLLSRNMTILNYLINMYDLRKNLRVVKFALS